MSQKIDDFKKLTEDKNGRELLRIFEDGIKINDSRKLNIHKIHYHEKDKIYYVLTKELTHFIKIDRNSFDEAFNEMDII